jgi:hypothetical protein
VAPETKTEVVLFSILAGVLGLAWYMHRSQGGDAGNADPLGDMLASLLGGSGATAPVADSGSLPLISAAVPYAASPGAGGDITFNFGGAGAFTVDSPLSINSPVQSAPMGVPGIAGCNSCQGAASAVTQYGGPAYALGNMLSGQDVALPAWN